MLDKLQPLKGKLEALLEKNEIPKEVVPAVLRTFVTRVGLITLSVRFLKEDTLEGVILWETVTEAISASATGALIETLNAHNVPKDAVIKIGATLNEITDEYTEIVAESFRAAMEADNAS